MATVVAVAAQKGGVGKTTTAVHLAAGLARRGARVLLVDACPQGQAAVHLGLEREPCLFELLIRPPGSGPDPLTLIRPARENLWLLPGDKETGVLQVVLAARMDPLDVFERALRPLRARFRYIVIDTGPGMGGLQERALFAADLVVVPVQVDFLGADGAERVLETLGILRERGGRAPGLAGVLPTFYDEVTRESRAVLSHLVSRFGEAVLSPVHRATVFREAAARGRTVYELGGPAAGRAAREYGLLVKRVQEVA